MKKEVFELEAELSECMKRSGENRRTECTSELAEDELLQGGNTGELEAVTTQDSDHQNELTSGGTLLIKHGCGVSCIFKL